MHGGDSDIKMELKFRRTYVTVRKKAWKEKSRWSRAA